MLDLVAIANDDCHRRHHIALCCQNRTATKYRTQMALSTATLDVCTPVVGQVHLDQNRSDAHDCVPYASIGRQELCRGRSEVRGELSSVALDHALDALDVGIDVELRHADAL